MNITKVPASATFDSLLVIITVWRYIPFAILEPYSFENVLRLQISTLKCCLSLQIFCNLLYTGNPLTRGFTMESGKSGSSLSRH